MEYGWIDSGCMSVKMRVVGGDMRASLAVKDERLRVTLGLVCKVNLKKTVIPLLDRNGIPLLSIRGGRLYARHTY